MTRRHVRPFVVCTLIRRFLVAVWFRVGCGIALNLDLYGRQWTWVKSTNLERGKQEGDVDRRALGFRLLRRYVREMGNYFVCTFEEKRLRVFENRVLRRIFGPKRDEVTGGWRKLRNEELHNLYSSPSIIRMIK
ncbi:hypothetical protein B7P43_G09115 [Cryptotermes secundus]|uniref:Uncharacterized protein n=1 Tax=Cryptotermes secundus TaxID=105785 RepID=A0A2J7Q4D1_9NEOP|nr:hypothetical protein B7P43_G09115 [Cryptotermes secundus]